MAPKDESIPCRWFTPRQLDAWLRAGKIRDAKALVGLLLWERLAPSRSLASRQHEN